MTAPTEAEIRAAVRQEWNRWRDPHADVAPWDKQPLSGRLVDCVQTDLYTDVGRLLYNLDAMGPWAGPLDAIEREIMAPIVAECERRILDGMAAAFERFAREHPKARRATREAVVA
jgi:hypothetical protein